MTIILKPKYEKTKAIKLPTNADSILSVEFNTPGKIKAAKAVKGINFRKRSKNNEIFVFEKITKGNTLGI
jgi:hypothetical protein